MSTVNMNFVVRISEDQISIFWEWICCSLGYIISVLISLETLDNSTMIDLPKVHVSAHPISWHLQRQRQMLT